MSADVPLPSPPATAHTGVTPPVMSRNPVRAGIVTAAAILITAIVSVGVVSFAIRDVFLKDLRTYLQRTAETAAANIDARAHARLRDSTRTGSLEHLAAAAPLRVLLRTNPDIRFAYSGIVRGDTMFYVLDGDTTSEAAYVMERDEPTDGEREVARTGVTVVEQRTSETAWGTGIRAYAPITRIDGSEGAGYPYVGVTMDASRHDAWLRRVYGMAALGVLVATLVAVGVGIRTTATERRREEAERSVARMREAAIAAAEERLALEQQLQSRQKMEALGTLAGGVAHDFNNLLTIILGQAELLCEDAEPGGEFAESAAAIRTAAARGRDVVRRILLFARPAAERRQPVALAPIVDETVQLLRTTLPRSVDIVWVPPAKPVIAVADAAQVTQVLMNLGVNASQAIPRQRGRIEFALERVTLPPTPGHEGVPPGDYARITVRDDGVGMSEQVRQRIFEPFFTTKTAEHGTGLGLSVVDGVVRGHGGAVEVTSQPGVGSCFTILLPASSAEGARPVAGAARLQPRESPDVLRLLLVDDDETVLRTTAKVLSRAGYLVDAFSDATQALEVLRATHGAYDVLITDRTMPVMSGPEVARRAREHFPALPVILLTGALQEGDRADPALAAVLTKPIDTAALVAEIEQVVAARA